MQRTTVRPFVPVLQVEAALRVAGISLKPERTRQLAEALTLADRFRNPVYWLSASGMIHWHGRQFGVGRRLAGVQMVILQPVLVGSVALGVICTPVDGVSLL